MLPILNDLKKDKRDSRKPTLFSMRLRRARLRTIKNGHRVTQKEMADAIGVTHSTYYRWEKGALVPTEKHVDKIAKIMGMDGDEVWLDTFRMPPDIYIFLTTTVEGAAVVRNIRKIMDKLNLTQPPTTRKGVPDDEHAARTAAHLSDRIRFSMDAD